MTAEELVGEFPKGLLKWYHFREGDRVLYVSAETQIDNSMAETLLECGLKTTVVSVREWEEQQISFDTEYDYAVVASALVLNPRMEYAGELLKKLRLCLRERGCLFVCADNRLGLRYFCGDQDPFTGRSFDGVENYKRVGPEDQKRQKGRLYAKAELEKLLEEAGFLHHRFYSVFPEISRPQILVSEDYAPTEELAVRLFPQYHNPDTVFLEEENLYTPLIQNGMFHSMANGFLIECPVDGAFSNANQITVSMDRGKENALCTVIRRDGLVEKRPLYLQGQRKLTRLMESQRELEGRGVHMVRGHIEKDAYVMPYVDGESLVGYFRRLAETDREECYRSFDKLWELICASSEHIPYEEVDWEHINPWWDIEERKKPEKKVDRSKWRDIVEEMEPGEEPFGPILRHGYIDLVLLNGFWWDHDFVFYDQELYMEHLPAKTVLLRNIDFLYMCNARMETILPRQELLERYGLDGDLEIYYAYIFYFLTELRNDEVLQDYNRQWRRNDEVLHSNRQRMNYSTEEYLRLFVHIFDKLDNKKLFLFGSGNFARKFLALYRDTYDIEAILDNNESKWGTDVEGIAIQSPEVLKELEPSTYKVIICIKNYLGVLRQLKEAGVTNLGIYDTSMEYPCGTRRLMQEQGVAGSVCGRSGADGEDAAKKYHVGYVAGVFDLFHIGHLNLLRRAKEQCDYLIAGVVTDEGVLKNKHTKSYVPFEERLAIVQACRYVDEAVGIPLEYCDTRDAYLKFQFDAQFSGSDYADDPLWLQKREFLHKHGAELVFFPYTEATNSTKIKRLIDQRLL